jgi:hypothetical protein
VRLLIVTAPAEQSCECRESHHDAPAAPAFADPDVERLDRGTFQTPETERPQRIDALVPEANLHTLVLPRSTQGMVLFETPLMRTYF